MSSSDSDDIEIDGFPPEIANNARFTSLKSCSDSLSNQKVYMPLTSWSPEVFIPEIIKICLRVLKDSSSFSENERKQILDQLESHAHPSIENTENEWSSKSNVRSHNFKNEINKPPSIKVNFEIPSMNANSNNIKYNIEKPTYDSEKHCWKISMDFLFQNENRAISENTYEVIQDNKETQTEKNTPKKKSSLTLPFGLEIRCKSEERLSFTGLTTNENLTTHLSFDAEIAVLEKFENTFENESDKSSILSESFRKYKVIIRKTIEKYIREVKKLQTQTESINSQYYLKISDSQFKWNTQNQLLLNDIEKELDSLTSKLNTKNENLKNLKLTDKTKELEKEIKSIKFSYSIRLVSQRLSNIKQQISMLNNELTGKTKTPFLNFK